MSQPLAIVFLMATVTNMMSAASAGDDIKPSFKITTGHARCGGIEGILIVANQSSLDPTDNRSIGLREIRDPLDGQLRAFCEASEAIRVPVRRFSSDSLPWACHQTHAVSLAAIRLPNRTGNAQPRKP